MRQLGEVRERRGADINQMLTLQVTGFSGRGPRGCGSSEERVFLIVGCGLPGSRRPMDTSSANPFILGLSQVSTVAQMLIVDAAKVSVSWRLVVVPPR